VRNAEAALKEAKSSGEKYLHHRIEMNSELARRVAMEHRCTRHSRNDNSCCTRHAPVERRGAELSAGERQPAEDRRPAVELQILEFAAWGLLAGGSYFLLALRPAPNG
jgi:hypothetical protein